MLQVRILGDALQLATANADADLSSDEMSSRRWSVWVRQVLICTAFLSDQEALNSCLAESHLDVAKDVKAWFNLAIRRGMLNVLRFKRRHVLLLYQRRCWHS